MPRISKKQERERREKLVDVAAKLFLIKGYDNTTINHLIDKLELAKGTFYYHFRSKEEILVAVCEKFLVDTVAKLTQIHAAKEQVINSRLKTMLAGIWDDFYKNMDVWEFVYQDNNVTLYHQLINISMKKLCPLFSDILEEGLAQGIFNVPYAEETAEVIVSLLDLFAQKICLDKDKVHRERVMTTMQHMFVLMLGKDAVPDFAENAWGSS